MAGIELRELRDELRTSGAFEHCEMRSWLKLFVLLAALAACLFVIATVGTWTALFAIPIAAVVSTSTAMLGHEGSHRSFSSSPARNLVLVYLTFPLFSGLGSSYWRNKHDRLHHAHPNVEGVDPDIKPFPFVSSAWSSTSVSKSTTTELSMLAIWRAYLNRCIAPRAGSPTIREVSGWACISHAALRRAMAAHLTLPPPRREARRSWRIYHK